MAKLKRSKAVSLDLDLDSALAVIPLLPGEPTRIAVRDNILRALADLLPDATPTEKARRLAEQLRQPPTGCDYDRYLQAVRQLSRRQAAPTAFQIVRVLRDAAKRA